MASMSSETKEPLDLMTDMCLTFYRGWSEVILGSLAPWTSPQAHLLGEAAAHSLEGSTELLESVTMAIDPQRQQARLDKRESQIDQQAADIARRESEISRREEQSIPLPKIEPPDMHLAETDEEIVVTAAFPGFEGDEVEARVRKGRLTIKGEKHRADGEGESHISYRRELPLPVPAAARESAARYHDGLLEVRIPKTPAVARKSSSAKAKETLQHEGVSRRPRASRRKSTARSQARSRGGKH